MTLNDLELSQLLTEINLKAACLSTFCRDAKEHALFMHLSDIEIAARKAQERLNRIKYDTTPVNYCKVEE